MSGRILKFPDPHQAVDEMLPWFVNGTLEGEDLALVERHLAECARCREEVEALREFQAAYLGSELVPALADIEQARPVQKPRVQGWIRWPRGWRSWWSSVAATRQFRRWAPLALAAELAVILVLAGVLVAGRESQPLYRTLGAVEPAAQQMGRLVVVFDPRVTEAELRRIVRGSGARIVDGPTVGDAYVLEVPAGRQAEALQALRGQRAVAMAERLNPGAAQ